jgi:hypothetical protein
VVEQILEEQVNKSLDSQWLDASGRLSTKTEDGRMSWVERCKNEVYSCRMKVGDRAQRLDDYFVFAGLVDVTGLEFTN